MALRNAMSSERKRIRLTNAPHKALTTKPMTNSPSLPPPTRRCPSRMRMQTANAPANAASGTAMLQPIAIASTTPIAAPPDVPIRLGSASGFSNNACNAAPLAESAAPTSKATKIRGRRISINTGSAASGLLHPPSPTPAQNQIRNKDKTGNAGSHFFML